MKVKTGEDLQQVRGWGLAANVVNLAEVGIVEVKDRNGRCSVKKTGTICCGEYVK